MQWGGKFFIKTPQIEIFDEFQSSRNVDKLENLIINPSFDDWGILVGDSIKFIGTKYNDDNVSMVIAINDEGTEITLSEILKNENTIGIPVKIQHYRKCNEIKTDVIYEGQEPIEVTTKKPTKKTSSIDDAKVRQGPPEYAPVGRKKKPKKGGTLGGN